MATKQQETLFGKTEVAPLAERMRPNRIDELVGHDAILGPGTFLGRMVRGAEPRSCILWGPPGSGKTTIARLLAAHSGYVLETLSAVLAGVKEVREVLERARQRRQMEGRGTILFVDEIHRFNRTQQDAFLPHVEAGAIVLVGATTENPSFELTGPLLSRCRTVVLQPLSADAIADLIERALHDGQRGLGALNLAIDDDARTFLATAADGDARTALGALESASDLTVAAGTSRITVALASEGLQKRPLRYDKSADEHYNVVSAFIKSLRGSNPNAALYWLARMLEAGEDPLFIARRMVIFASEDVGLADPQALPLAIAVKEAVDFVGLPEARINLAHGAAYLARAEKSNASYMGLIAATEEVQRTGSRPVPLHLRNAPTRLTQALGYGRDYVYPHGREEEAAGQRYLPDGLSNEAFVEAPLPPPREKKSRQ